MYKKRFKKFSLSLMAAVLFLSMVPMTASALEEIKDEEIVEEIVDIDETDEELELLDGAIEEEIEEVEEVEEETEEIKTVEEEVVSPRNTENPVIVDLEHDPTFRTYTNNYTGAQIPTFALTVNFSVNKDNLEGVVVEVPLDGYIVDNSNPVFQHFTTQGSIFSLNSFVEPDPESTMFKSVKYDEDNNKIVVELNKTESGVQNLNFSFTFNEDFDSIIPGGQVIWDNMHASVYIPETDETYEYPSVDLTSTTNSSYGIVLTRFNPTSSEFTGGEIPVRNRVRADYTEFHKTDFDTYENKHYYEVPIGTTVTNTPSYVDLTTGETSEDDSSIPEGYIRYYGVFNSDDELAGTVNPDAPWNQFRNRDTKFEIDMSAFSVGDTFEIRSGLMFKKYNGEETHVSDSVQYVVTEQSDWNLVGNGMNATGSSLEPNSVINMDNPNHISRSVTIFGWGTYGHASTIKNEGTEPITGVRYELYNDADPHIKMNFNSLQVFAMAANDTIETPSYEMIYDITNVDGSSRNETTGIITNKPNNTHTPPSLNAGE